MINSRKKTVLSNLSAIWSVMVLGTMAGFFWTYSFNVNYATLNLGADDYATVQSLFNVNVRHGMFFFFFFGGVFFTALAAVLSRMEENSRRVRLQLWALGVYLLGVVVFTHQVNLPLNAVTESWVVGAVPADWQTTRDHWNMANLFRVATSFSAFVLGLFALLTRPDEESS